MLVQELEANGKPLVDASVTFFCRCLLPGDYVYDSTVGLQMPRSAAFQAAGWKCEPLFGLQAAMLLSKGVVVEDMLTSFLRHITS